MEANSNVLIVDAMNIAFRWKHQGKLEFELDYMRTVESLAQSYECSKIIIAADWGNSKYRKDECPQYKENRKERYKDQTEQEKEDIRLFFEEYERTLKSLEEKFLVLRYHQVEADDIAAYVVKNRENYGIDDVWLISSDRDWDLLVDEYVLTGDKGDNVDGIPGIGPKRATDLIHQYGSAFDIYDAIPLEGKYKYIQALNESGDLILQNYKMMDLITYCDEAIEYPGHSLSEIDDRVKEFMNVN
jgi:5'-3' exonuclease